MLLALLLILQLLILLLLNLLQLLLLQYLLSILVGGGRGVAQRSCQQNQHQNLANRHGGLPG
ncbi:hypothetical protein [Silvimonas iriomotensis]|uniref:Uncharacterized protein n=1 Tax=Silvimonas iriomotensis TaxID=449662 RepID=A0ABQ2P5A8_9NEIS|nr:hypothetical protein [Silvimonas iriomotensis]GGP18548.1 hypothetical protein GCM10010970_05610 [Silvimonas iriomotensis]